MKKKKEKKESYIQFLNLSFLSHQISIMVPNSGDDCKSVSHMC